MKYTILSKVNDARINRRAQQEVRNSLIDLEGKDIIITIETKRKKRSQNQNAYYWGCVVSEFRLGALEMWGEHIDSEQAHEYLKYHCNYKELINENTGEIVKLPQSTTTHTTLQFEEYLERCRKLIYEMFGRIVLLPNEQSEVKFL
jgi:hypothetical protein